MEHLLKSWLLPQSGRKKFNASNLSYSLSKLLDPHRFAVVNESYVDVHDLSSEQPDVVVYDLNKDFKTAMMIEVTDHDNLDTTLRTMEIISQLYKVPEAFVFDFEAQKWFRVKNSEVQTSASSEQFGFDLNSILSHSLHRYKA